MNKKNSLKTRIHPKIYIFCNGELAEPQYFQEYKDHLKGHNIKIEYKNFKGLAPWQFIEKVIKRKDELIKKEKFSEEDNDQIWCVFDIDQYLKENRKKFLKYIKKAKEEKINLAWSNECFELWFLIHFILPTTEISKNDYGKKLKIHLKKLDKKGYFKNQKGMFKRLLPLQVIAIKMAKSYSIKIKNMKSAHPLQFFFW
jgi:hypothetical protein